MKNVFKFKTTLSCNGCRSKLAPFLDEKEGITDWEVDLGDPDKILTVHADGITADEVRILVEQAGYRAVEIRSIHPA